MMGATDYTVLAELLDRGPKVLYSSTARSSHLQESVVRTNNRAEAQSGPVATASDGLESAMPGQQVVYCVRAVRARGPV